VIQLQEAGAHEGHLPGFEEQTGGERAEARGGVQFLSQGGLPHGGRVLGEEPADEAKQVEEAGWRGQVRLRCRHCGAECTPAGGDGAARVHRLDGGDQHQLPQGSLCSLCRRRPLSCAPPRWSSATPLQPRAPRERRSGRLPGQRGIECGWEGRPLGFGRRERGGPRRAWTPHRQRQKWAAGGDS
jgi:hypothetical protein